MRTREIVRHGVESALDLARAIKGFYPEIAKAAQSQDAVAETMARNGAQHWAQKLAELYSDGEVRQALRVNKIQPKDFEAILGRPYGN